ncbi:L10-interacting MYB domain-containing protein-like isoform X2 [Corylus avellana]|uniref:L10-interacting MYB domain-containing protein-like isoform X2 n=1 Tax=Corylus avellana TaxID=13451 RepID=UPI00286A9B61|nr:L10-interacting MYB domain-containing protein-like isoform X2 [Corylus avellana]
MPEKRSRKQSNRGSDSKTIDNQTSEEQSEDVWSRPNWPPRTEKIFVELLIEEMKYHLDVCVSGFDEKAWDRVCKEFNQETGLNYDKKELKKHLTILRKRYRIVKPLYNHGGFGWDYRRKMVDVDDHIWAEYIQAYPEIKPYRKWGCPIYEELCTIFTKPKATGQYAYASTGWSRSGSIDLPRSHGCNKRQAQAAQPQVSGANKKHHKGAENSKGAAACKKPMLEKNIHVIEK